MCWERTFQVVSCQWRCRLDDLQMMAFHRGSSCGCCIPRKFSPGAARRMQMFVRQEISGRDEKVLCVWDTGSPSKMSPDACILTSVLLWFFQSSFSAWFHRVHILYFRGMRWGGGIFFFILLQLSCESLDFYIYFLDSLCAITLIRFRLPPLRYSACIP